MGTCGVRQSRTKGLLCCQCCGENHTEFGFACVDADIELVKKFLDEKKYTVQDISIGLDIARSNAELFGILLAHSVEENLQYVCKQIGYRKRMALLNTIMRFKRDDFSDFKDLDADMLVRLKEVNRTLCAKKSWNTILPHFMTLVFQNYYTNHRNYNFAELQNEYDMSLKFIRRLLLWLKDSEEEMMVRHKLKDYLGHIGKADVIDIMGL